MTSAFLLSCLVGVIGATAELATQETLGFTEPRDGTTVSSLTSSIHTVIPGSSYIVKLECHNCPYLGSVQDSEQQWGADVTPNFLVSACCVVCLLIIIEVDRKDSF